MICHQNAPAPKSMVAPDEICALMERVATVDDLRRARDIAVVFASRHGRRPYCPSGRLGDDFNYHLMLATIYQAGRVQGIREERRKGPFRKKYRTETLSV